MSGLNGIGPNLGQTAAERLSASAALRQLAGNTGRVARNFGHGLLQDHATLKANSLIVSSLILVISRILVANFSAYKAKGTPDGPYRYHEAMRTNIREVCGWTFGFVVLRAFQGLIKKGIGRFFGVVETGGPEKIPVFKQLGQSIANAWQRKSFTVPKPPLDPAIPAVFDFTNKARFEWLRPVLEKLPASKGKTAAEMLRGFYNWTPILLGSIPAVFLAGYMLERFTLDHSNHVVDVISKRFNRGGGKNPQSPNQAAARFDSFVSRVHYKQAERAAQGFPLQDA